MPEDHAGDAGLTAEIMRRFNDGFLRHDASASPPWWRRIA